MNIEALKEILLKMYHRGMRKKAIQTLFVYLKNLTPPNAQNLNPNLIAVKNDLTFQETLQLVTFGVLYGLFRMEWQVFCPKCGQLNFSATLVKELPESQSCQSCGYHYHPEADQNIAVTVSIHPKLFATEPDSVNEPPPPSDDRVKPLTLLDLIGFPPFRDAFTKQVPALDQSIKVGMVTVIFTDLIQSTALYEHIGDAQAYVLIRMHFHLLFDSIIRHFGGVIKTIGDAVMAVFNDPVQALEAGLQIKKQINAFLKQQLPDFPTGIKIGMHTGPAVLVNLNNSFDLFGSTVNMAARLVNYARLESIAVSKDFYEASEIQSRLKELPLRAKPFDAHLKGISDIQKIYLIAEHDA